MATEVVQKWTFGDPVLEAGGKGKATWTQSLSVGSERGKWAVRLDAGPQSSWDDYAKVVIPINELHFHLLKSVRLQAKYTAAVGIDMGVCIYLHNPTNLDDRIELSHTPLTNSAAGTRELNYPTDVPVGHAFFWYGTVSGTPDTCPTEGSAYTWAQFQADSVFKTWTIYKITLDYGYHTGDMVMNECYLTQAFINGSPVQLEPSIQEQIALSYDRTADAIKNIPTWTFGEPTLSYAKNSRAYWSRTTIDPRYHMSGANWKACLHGRVQTGDDWAALVIPVNEMPVPDFNTAYWSYVMTSAQTMGANIVFWTHDPANFIYRAEITQDASTGNAGLTKTAGRNAHVFNPATTQMFYYGEITGTPDTCPTAGTKYTWAQFQVDSVFSKYTIYKITIEMGWEASGTFDHVWIGDLNLNGTNILLQPRSDADLAPIHDLKDTQSALALTIAPKTPFQLLSLDLHASAALAGTALTITKDAGADGLTNSTYFDTLIYSVDMPTLAITSLHKTFEGIESFAEDDELDIAQSNTGSKNIGCSVYWKPI